MKYIAKDSATAHKNNENCSVIEYEFENEKDFDIAILKLTGRYPTKGYVFNEVCKERAYVSEGSGTVTTPEGTTQLTAGDMIFIQTNDRYFFDGTMTLVVCASPAWYPEQHRTTFEA